MKKKIFLLLAFIVIWFTELNASHHFFLVDGSGSMSGAPIKKAKDAMQKLANKLFIIGDSVAVVVSRGDCNNSISLNSDFVSEIKKLTPILDSINTGGGNTIPDGFKFVQKYMDDNSLSGHIFLFGDGDGVEECDGIKYIANKLKKDNKLTPFTYIGLDWSEEEQKHWKEVLLELNCEIFDYNQIASTSQDSSSKQHFNKVKYLNRDGSINDGKNYLSNPWQCIESDGLVWYSHSQNEQLIDFFLEKPKRKNFTSHCFENSTKKYRNCLVEEFVTFLNSSQICGCKQWRLPDYNELKRITYLNKNKFDNYFPYVRIWPHISITRGKYKGYVRGINFDNDNTYDFKADRPYAAIFVSGPIDKLQFYIPEKLEKKAKKKNSINNIQIKSNTNVSVDSNNKNKIIKNKCTVEYVQKVLKDKNLYHGLINGNFNLRTQSAIENYQRQHPKLNISGTLDSETCNYLLKEGGGK